MVQGCMETVLMCWSVTPYHKDRGEIMHQLELKYVSLNFREIQIFLH